VHFDNIKFFLPINYKPINKALYCEKNFNIQLEVKVDKDGLKLDGTHQLLVYADHVNLLGGRVHII
jgi:hypothetical protein